MPKIEQFLPESVRVLSQGTIVAQSLVHYLVRHPEMETRCSKNGEVKYFTTASATDFETKAAIFMEKAVRAQHLALAI